MEGVPGQDSVRGVVTRRELGIHFLSYRTATHNITPFEHEYVSACFREVSGCCQAVMAGTDNQYVGLHVRTRRV